MTPERRAELVAIRAAKRAARERQQAAEFMRRNYHLATFGPGCEAGNAAERIYQALGR